MKLYATIESERAKKGQGGEDLVITITGAHKTELVTMVVRPDGDHYRIDGWTHDNHRIDISISENMQRKGEKKKGEICQYCGTPEGSRKQCDPNNKVLMHSWQ